MPLTVRSVAKAWTNSVRFAGTACFQGCAHFGLTHEGPMDNLRHWPFRSFAITLTLATTLGLQWAEGRAAKVNVLKFNIDQVSGDTVSSDGLEDSAAWQYADYRVSALPGTPPVCVDAQNAAG